MIAVATLAFWFSALLLFHVFMGYPLCMWWLARVLPRRVRKEVATPTMTMPTVTVVIAAHEAGAHIRAKLTNVFALDYPGERLDIIVVCDGCRDDTAEQCREVTDPRIRVMEFAERRGKASCLNDAIAAASGDVLLMTDVRQNLDPGALRELVANLADPAVGAVSGELRLLDALTGFARGVDAYWRYEKLIRHAESRSGSTVGVTGALYAMRRELFRPLPEGTVLDDVLIPMRIAAAGRRVVFEPLALGWDRPSQHPAEERRRKIRTLAGNYQLIQLAPWLLVPWSNPLWWRFVSHKLLRLLAPWLLLLAALASAVIATRHALYLLPLLALFAGVGLVVLGRRMPATEHLLPVRLVVAFWYLNLFAAQALIAFARNRRLHLW
jgi:cellulose synthase/poly-beta-1,6-N-acetylglucosamine synthase-like glycosyltransferase